MILNCPYCGIEFVKSDEHRKYCSVEHERKYNHDKQDKNKKRKHDREYESISIQSMSDSYIRKLIWRDLNGAIKGADITPEMIISRRNKLADHRKRAKERIKTYPSRKVWFKECVVCGEIFIARQEQVSPCCSQCQYEEFKASKRERYIPKPKKRRQCIVCGNVFEGHSRDKYCSKLCSNKNKNLNKPGSDRKRARAFNVEYEYINPMKVFRRDSWHCQICGKATPKKNRGKRYSNSPELDHRIPMSKGGHHLYSNVQCACKKCNMIKSNHNNEGQIPLYEIVTS